MLARLDLSSNRIDNDATTALARALEDNTGLRTLLLGDNHISMDGVQKLCAALLNNVTLMNVALCGNDLSQPRACAYIADALRGNSTLMEVCHR